MRWLAFQCVFFILLLSLACREQSKEEILQQGMEFYRSGNLQAAIALFKNALEKDPNFVDARLALGNAYFELDKFDFAERELDKVKRQNPKSFEISLRLAQIYQKTDRIDLSLEELRSLEKSYPGDATLFTALAECYALKGDFTTSEDMYRKVLYSKPADLNARLGLIRVLFATKRFEAGRQLLQTVIAEYPDNPEPLHLQLKLAIRNADRAGAISILKRIRQINDKDMAITYLLGLMLLDSGEIDSARKLANSIKSVKPDHPVAFRLDGLANYLEGKYGQALQELQKSTVRMSDLIGYYSIGLTFYQLAYYEQAISSFQKALDLSPKHEQSRLLIAQTFLKQGKVDECIYYLEKILQINPNNAMAYNILGRVYLMQGKYDQAMVMLDKAIEIDPGLAHAYINKGLFNIVAGNLKNGEKDLQNAVTAAPELVNARLLLAKYYLRGQNYSMAIKVLKEGLSVASDKAIIHNYLASAYLMQNNHADAVASLQKAKAIKSDYLAPYFNLANFHVNRKDYQSAISEYQLALKSAPNNPTVLARMAAVYELAGDRSQAESCFQQAAAVGDPDGCLAYSAFLFRSGQRVRCLETLKAGYAAHPDNLNIAKVLGNVLQADNQLDEAVKVYSHMEEVAPGSGIPLLIGAYLQKGDIKAANDLAGLTIAKKPGTEDGYLLQSAIHEYRKEWVMAETIIKRGIASCNNDRDLKMKLAGIFASQGNLERALQVYENVSLEHPQFVPAIFAKGSIFDAQGNKIKAKEQYKAALALDENYAPALNNLAYLLMEVYGDHKEALRLATKAFRIMPEEPTFIDTLGYALLKNGQADKAVVFLEKATRLRPNDQAIQLHLTQANRAAVRHVGIKDDSSKAL